MIPGPWTLIACVVALLVGVSWRVVFLYLVLDKLVVFLLGQGATIKSAWLVICTVAIVVGVGAFLVRGWLDERIIAASKAEVEASKATLALRDEELKSKLGTAAPDDIKAQIDGLKSELAAIRPRRLSADNIDKMAAIMGKSSGFLRVVLPSEQVNDAYDYGRDFRKVIERAGWKTDYTMPFASFGQSPHGLCLVVPDPASLTPTQALIVAALKAANLSFDVQAEPKRPTPPGVPASAPDPNAPDAMLVVSRKAD